MRLVVVSNRVVLPQTQQKPSAGGLGVAVKAALRRRGGLWFGWSGEIADKTSAEPKRVNANRLDYATIDLTGEDLQKYYNGFANRVLWPVMHYRVDLQDYSRADETGYVRVNRLFAARLEKIIEKDDIIWVHDYHLLLLARELRARGVMNPIGLFMHIPCAPPDILRTLPYHENILGSLTHYDLVGFQTENDRGNFAQYLSSLGPKSVRGQVYEFDGRQVRIGVFPVGIETAPYARLARKAARSPFVMGVVESLAGQRLILGVDRLDYSKGLLQRLHAFERFLEIAPEWRSRVTFLQIAPKSRSEVKEYREIENEVTTLVGAINGRFGEASWTPVRYVNRSYSRTALAGVYRAADVALVTPLRDGMNLVAKEFLAAQDENQPGVLILSRFAGAAEELSGALIVNPHEVDAVAGAIRQALEMPALERRDRHRPMLAYLQDHTVERWADSFLSSLVSTRQRPRMFEGLRSMLSVATFF